MGYARKTGRATGQAVNETGLYQRDGPYYGIGHACWQHNNLLDKIMIRVETLAYAYFRYAVGVDSKP